MIDTINQILSKCKDTNKGILDTVEIVLSDNELIDGKWIIRAENATLYYFDEDSGEESVWLDPKTFFRITEGNRSYVPKFKK